LDSRVSWVTVFQFRVVAASPDLPSISLVLILIRRVIIAITRDGL